MWCCLRFPSLPLDVFERGRDVRQATPFVVASGGHHPCVVAANAAARGRGIRDGQLVSAALALAPDVVLRDREPAQEKEALAQLATFALAFTPMVAMVPHDAVVAEIGPSLRLFGGLAALVRALRAGVAERGFDATLGLAPTPAAAIALARAGNRAARDPATLPRVLWPLPLAHFDVDADALATLAAAGVCTFGDACALPRDGLARRFGGELVAALDRALGRIPDPRAPFVPPPRFEAKLELPAPVEDAEALGFAVNRLVHDLAAWLLARGLGVLDVSLALLHERARMRGRESPVTAASFALGAPTRTPAHLSTVLRERIARLALPAPVEAIALASGTTSPLAGRNLGLLPGDEASAAAVPLVDRLRARLGDGAVVRVRPLAEHRPERAHGERAERHDARDPPPLAAAPRPVWLLAQPKPLGTLPEGRAWILRDGPERIESGWWDGDDVRRDYFVAETPEGEVLWIFRDHRHGIADGEWFVHGRFG
jgi:protein ImuB